MRRQPAAMTMQITLNGNPKMLGNATTVAQLLAELDLAGKRVAVEVNCEIVPRSEHDRFTLNEKDRVEVVQAIGGG
jgi:sulfur carrier protein